MHPSNFANSFSNTLLPFIRGQISVSGKGYNDPISAEMRRTYHLLKLNIIKMEALKLAPFKTLRDKVKFCTIPLKDLPETKLEALSGILRTFQNKPFRYNEASYSSNLWLPLLRTLFSDESVCNEPKVSLKEINPDYPDLKPDFIIKLNFNHEVIPLLFVELSRDHLRSESLSHKDEDKIAISMAASLLKFFGMFIDQGRGFLERLCIYGILGAASDFDLVMLYPVFPDPANEDEFYFAFQSSKRHLRFHILEDCLFSEDMIICSGSQQLYHGPIDQEPIETNSVEPESINRNPSNKIDPDELFCEFIFKEGVLNPRALKVLERVSELVYAQAELVQSVLNARRNPPDPSFKYDNYQISKMIKSRSSHDTPSPKKAKREKLDVHIDRAIPFTITQVILSLDIGKENADEKVNKSNNQDRSKVSIPTIKISKEPSKYEIEIYKELKGYAQFPLLLSYEFFQDDLLRLELERVSPLSSDVHLFDAKGESFYTKLLVDVMGALRILHSKGFVHGDVTPSNIGYNSNRKLWNLFDFDSSRTIKEAVEAGDKEISYKSTELYVSRNYKESGFSEYYPFDDYVGLAMSCEDVMDSSISTLPREFKNKFGAFLDLIINCDDSNLEQEQLDFLYLEALKFHLEYSEAPTAEDPSIKAALPLLEEMKNKYK